MKNIIVVSVMFDQVDAIAGPLTEGEAKQLVTEMEDKYGMEEWSFQAHKLLSISQFKKDIRRSTS
jgi:hypothetical protein